MPSAYFKSEGLVTRKMPFGEADFLVRMLTKDFGKMDALAKGARKTASKLNAHLDMLNLVRIQFVRNGERIPTLMDAEIINKFDDWFLDADKLSIAGRVLQILDIIILPGAKDEKLFEMILDFFSVQGGKSTLEQDALKFLHDFFAHEGHGEALPPEHMQNIIKLFPQLK